MILKQIFEDCWEWWNFCKYCASSDLSLFRDEKKVGINRAFWTNRVKCDKSGRWRISCGLYSLVYVQICENISWISKLKKTAKNRETLCKIYQMSRWELKIFQKCRLFLINSNILFSEILHVPDLSHFHGQKVGMNRGVTNRTMHSIDNKKVHTYAE